MDLKYIFQIIWNWSWLIFLGALLSGVFALAISRRIDPMYKASTTLVVRANGSGADSLYDTMLTIERLTKIYAEMPRKRPVLEAVISNLQLTINPTSLANRVRVTISPETMLILLTVEDTSPQQAANIANEIVKVLRQEGQYILGSRYTTSRYDLNIIEAARPDPRPVYPRPARNAILAMLVGGLLILGGVFLNEYLDNSVRSRETVQALTGLTTLATIPSISGLRPGSKLTRTQERHSPVSETYRRIRTHIEFAALQQPVRTLVITSGQPREGKSLTAANLAIALARTGKRIILVDADLRCPTLHTLFRQSNSRGVTTALDREDKHAISSDLVATGIDNLTLMPSGPLPPDPAERLGSPAMRELITTLAQQTDMVIFDSPALLAVVDATVLARNCDATLLVVQAGTTPQAELVQVQQQLYQFRIRLLGVVLNRTRYERGQRYGYYTRPRQHGFALLQRIRNRRVNRPTDDGHAETTLPGKAGKEPSPDNRRTDQHQQAFGQSME